MLGGLLHMTKELLTEYFRSTTKQGSFSCREIFKNQNELWMDKVSGRYMIYSKDKKTKTAQKMWFEKGIACIPTVYGFKNEKIIITKLEDGIWDVRLSNTEDINANQRNKFDVNIHNGGYLFFSKPIAKHLHVGEDDWILNVICVNNRNDGSYMVIRAEKSGITNYETIEPTNKGVTFKLGRFVYSTTLHNNGMYLPKSFRTLTGIRDNSHVPEWLRSDGAVIIEGRPGICKCCGKHISRYKTPITDVCNSCDPKQMTIFDRQIIKYANFFENK